MRQAWTDFGLRVEKRIVSALDVASILVLDAVILLLGFLVIKGAEKVADPPNAFFDVVVQVSHGAFLLLYVAFAGRHLWEFIKSE
ncbi:MAG: hypothetical protein WBS19_15800 [Candidatus Korobacteraceae bacterium]